jgi:hypothetical protein
MINSNRVACSIGRSPGYSTFQDLIDEVSSAPIENSEIHGHRTSRRTIANREVVICSPVRTAIGTHGGTLKDTPAADSAVVVRAPLNRAKLPLMMWIRLSWAT